MRRILTALVACAVLFITLGSSAEASVDGAERAVTHRIESDFMLDLSAYAYCNKAGKNRYNCTWNAYESWDDEFQGRARVTQHGKRYSVSYRVS